MKRKLSDKRTLKSSEAGISKSLIICTRWVHPVSCCGDSDETGIYRFVLCRKMPERLESIEKATENLQSVNKDLIYLLEAEEQECNDL